MAVVIWVFAGGGESEIIGLIPFMEKHFACQFQRKTPMRRRLRPRPVAGEHPQRQDAVVSYGRTGESLAQHIKTQLKRSLIGGERCDLILILDDLDCHEIEQRRKMFKDAIDSVPEAEGIDIFIAFASPEIEAWLVADWDNSIAKHVDFRKKHERMRWWLSHERNVPFNEPERFSEYDPCKHACKDKLSDTIIESATLYGEPEDSHYSKKIHTPHLLQQIDPKVVSLKCPLFRGLYTHLNNCCPGDQ